MSAWRYRPEKRRPANAGSKRSTGVWIMSFRADPLNSDFGQALLYLLDDVQFRQVPVVVFNFGFQHGRVLLGSRKDRDESDAAHLHQHGVDEFADPLWASSIE